MGYPSVNFTNGQRNARGPHPPGKGRRPPVIPQSTAASRPETRHRASAERFPASGQGWFGLVWSALGAAFVYAIASAESPINAVGQIGGYLSTYLGFGASVLGVTIWQRSQEKRNGRA
ncbi:hypothetical protein C8N35_102318 [Breoghania corrubedonensis]|uniref:Uncharacterized protein n=1 Tax=Breoghania corrubedonensis TaxID=665038 RepID=A0A2T5VCW6_9HYPH|nr:hypothetical protein [Breoghania corrubedonensis]PTW61603.1 hypothetical protein C8N35_102318 [Breoghania corrubedonensis]